MFWKEQPIHVIDFEGSPRYGVVEFGVVTLLGGQIARTRTGLCAPSAEMTTREIALHGIRAKDTLGAAPFAEHRELFFELRKGGVLAAHHASVENGFLKRTWAYPPLCDDFSDEGVTAADRIESQTAPPGSAFERSCSPTRRKVADWGPWIDTRALYAAVYPGLTSYALGELVKTFALSQSLVDLATQYCPPTRRKSHCALYDALASVLLLLHLGAQEGFEHLPLKWLIEHSAASADALNEHRQQKFL